MFSLDPIYAPIERAIIPGASVSIFDGNTVISKQAGWRTKDDPLDQRTQFPIGCLIKTIISLIVYELAQEGKISIDSTVGSYIKGLASSSVTVRHLLDHTAGYQEPQDLKKRWSLSIDEIINCVLRGSAYSPGTAFSYSHSGYVLLAKIIEQVECAGLADIINERVATRIGLPSFPSGMTHRPTSSDATMFVRVGENKLMPYRAPVDNGEMRLAISSVTLSPEDLIRLGCHLLEKSRITGSSPFEPTAKLSTVAGPDDVEIVPTHWGRGVAHFGSLSGQTGSYLASTSVLYIDPANGTIVACSVNAWNPFFRQMLALHVSKEIGQAQPSRHGSHLRTAFKIGDLIGSYRPLTFGMRPIVITPDGRCSGAFQGRLFESDEGLQVMGSESPGTIGIEIHPQTDAPLLRSDLSLYVRDA